MSRAKWHAVCDGYGFMGIAIDRLATCMVYMGKAVTSATICIHTDEVSSRGDEDSVKFGDYGVIRSYET